MALSYKMLPDLFVFTNGKGAAWYGPVTLCLEWHNYADSSWNVRPFQKIGGRAVQKGTALSREGAVLQRRWPALTTTLSKRGWAGKRQLMPHFWKPDKLLKLSLILSSILKVIENVQLKWLWRIDKFSCHSVNSMCNYAKQNHQLHSECASTGNDSLAQAFFEGLDFGYLHRMQPPINIQATLSTWKDWASILSDAQRVLLWESTPDKSILCFSNHYFVASFFK